MSRLLEALEAALRGQAGEIELAAVHARQGTTRFANSRVTQTGEVEDLVVQARVSDEGRLGAARAGAVDTVSIAAAIARAREIAASQKKSEEPRLDFSGAAQNEPDATSARYAEDAVSDADARARLIEPAFRATAKAGLTAAGLASVTRTTHAIVTTRGRRGVYRRTSAKLDVIASGENTSARLGRCATSPLALTRDAETLALEAVERALRGRDPVELEPGEYDVILEPAAVAELLEWLALTSLGARSVEDGSSCLAGRAGEPLTSAAVTLYDDARAGEEGCPQDPFDAEGSPTQRVVFLDGGRVRGPVHDLATGARAGVASTGHAPPVGDELFEGGPVPTHLHMAGGADDVNALLARVERGLWVSRFHYVNGLLDTRRALMTGMTRDGLFLVENGKLSRGVRNLRWTESLLEGFARLDGVTRARQVVAAGLSDSVYVCPTVLVRRWRFTGKSR